VALFYAVPRGRDCNCITRCSIDVSKLALSTQNDRKTQRIAFVTALLDLEGKMVAAEEGRMELALKGATYENLARTSVDAKLSFEMAPRVYNLREVVEEAVNGKLASSTNSIDLRQLVQ
jgi:hypothetical protein